MGDQDANTVFVPFSTLKTVFNFGDKVGFFALTAKPGSDGVQLEKDVREVLSRHHRVSPTDKLAIGSFNMFEVFGRFSTFLFIIALMAWVVGGATLMAGVVGVSNIMLITVKERTKEIGVRKALGATPSSIVFMVIQEAVFLTGIAGLLGLAGGVFLLSVIDSAHLTAFIRDPSISLKLGVGATLFLVLTGAFAGYFPARAAARINPIHALRDE